MYEFMPTVCLYPCSYSSGLETLALLPPIQENPTSPDFSNTVTRTGPSLSWHPSMPLCDTLPFAHVCLLQLIQNFSEVNAILNPKWVAFIKPLSSGLRELWVRGIKKGVDDTKEAASSRHNRMDIHMNSQRRWQYAQDLPRSKLDSVPVLRVGRGHGLPSLTKQLSPSDSHLQRETQFSLMESHCVYKAHLKVSSLSSRWWSMQNELNGMFLQVLSDVLSMDIFHLAGLLLVSDFVFLWVLCFCVYVCLSVCMFIVLSSFF